MMVEVLWLRHGLGGVDVIDDTWVAAFDRWGHVNTEVLAGSPGEMRLRAALLRRMQMEWKGK